MSVEVVILVLSGLVAVNLVLVSALVSATRRDRALHPPKDGRQTRRTRREGAGQLPEDRRD